MAVSAICSFESLSPLSFSRHYTVDKLAKESPLDYEKRTWREKCHVNEKGFVFIPPMAFKLCLAEAAKYRSTRIPGKGTSTYTKHFEAGVLVLEPLVLPIKKEDIASEWLFLPSDGRRGGGKRVERCFPLVPQWKGDVTFFVLDQTITEDVFRDHITEMGNFIGLLRFRPRNNGYYGRFTLKKLVWRVE